MEDFAARNAGRKRRRNPRGEGARLRDEIIDAATTLLEQSGTEGSISLRAIARQVGVTAPSISDHFADVTEIIDAVVARELSTFYSSLRASSASSTEPVEHLGALCRAYVEYGSRYPARYRVLVGRHFIDDWERRLLTMEQTAPLMGASIALVIDAVQACIDSGASASTDATLDTYVLWFALHGLVTVTQAIPSIDWPDRERLVSSCFHSAARLLTNP